MIIGYTIKKDDPQECHRLRHEGGCEQIYHVEESKWLMEDFEAFLRQHQDAQIVVVNFGSIGLPISRWRYIATLISEVTQSFHFLDKETPSDRAYLALLSQLSDYEQEWMKRRTLAGLKKSKARGVVGGRPPIDHDLVNRIKFLYLKQNRTIRETALLTGVSIGTVHKYIKQCETTPS